MKIFISGIAIVLVALFSFSVLFIRNKIELIGYDTFYKWPSGNINKSFNAITGQYEVIVEQYNENTDFLLLEQFERASELFPNEDLELVIVSHIDRLERDLVSKNKSITPKKASLVEHSILSSPRLSSKSRRRSPTISKKLIPFTPSDTRRADRFKR